jgi:hypothetical protein
VSSQRVATLAAAIAAALIIAPGRASAQTQGAAVTSADGQRLQTGINRTARQIADLRSQDPSLATRLDRELNDLSDEAVYFKVKLSKGETISRAEFDDVQNRLADLTSRVPGSPPPSSSPSSATPPPPRTSPPGPSTSSEPPSEQRVYSSTPGVLPVGTEFDVRLQDALSSATAKVEDRVTATTMVDLQQGDRVLVPAGSVVQGIVQSVQKATRTERKGSVTVSFNRITIHGKSYPIRGTVAQALESEGIRGEVGKIGTGAGVGAIIGGIIGGAKGALAGILIGAGGTVAATEGTDLNLPPGTVLRVRLDSPLDLR